MKNLELKGKIIGVLLIIISLISCKINSSDNSDNKDNFSQDKLKNQESVSISDMDNFIDNFSGVWIPTNYLMDIKSNKSAYLSQNSIPLFSELSIHRRNLKDDKLFVSGSLNNHEGHRFMIWFSKDDVDGEISNDIFSWNKAKNFVFKYTLNPDTALYIIDATDSLRKEIKFSKVLDSTHVSDYGAKGYDYIARSMVLTGEFQILDSLDNKKGISKFDPLTGVINGFDYNYYTITTDYMAFPCYSSDHIILRAGEEDYTGQTCLTMINKNDTILLYDTQEIVTDTTFDIKLKSIKYKLISKNY